MQLLIAVIAYLYYQNEVNNKKEALFLQMQNYSLSLKGNKFTLDIATKSSKYNNYMLYEEENLFAFFPIGGIEDTVLKVILDKSIYDEMKTQISTNIYLYLFAGAFVLMILSFLFSLYSLKPLRDSISFLEEFLKDMIHDLNTPVSAILLNSRMLKKSYKIERVERIEISAKTISSLHSNLETFIRDIPLALTTVNITALAKERMSYFESIYGKDLHFEIDAKEVLIQSSEDALRRILDNIISNACKYNKSNGWVKLTLTEDRLVISDSGLGIKDTKRIFERFYKEGERGLGIGLSIVKKLSKALNIHIQVTSSPEGTTFNLLW